MRRSTIAVLPVIFFGLITCNQSQSKSDKTGPAMVETKPQPIVQERLSCPEPVVFPSVDSAKINIITTEYGAGVAKNVLQVPICVEINSSNSQLDKINKNGSNLRFTKPDGTSLAFLIERWDDSLRRCTVRVLMDTVYGNQSSQFFYMLRGAVDLVPLSSDTQTLAAALETMKKAVWREEHEFEVQNDSLPPPDKDWVRLTNSEWGDGYTIISIVPIRHRPVLSINRFSASIKPGDSSAFELILERQIAFSLPHSCVARLRITGTAKPEIDYRGGISSIQSVIIPENERIIKKILWLVPYIHYGEKQTLTVTILPDPENNYIVGHECTQTISFSGN